MKILKLRFNNLNSLYGQWEIDFTSSEYISSGIFAIVGSTGAGKSTILDAISLALYGRTPRLSTVSVSTNEVMSRGTGACYAEVFFEVSGVCYSAHWSQRRARGKASGTLQNSKHKLDDITNSKPVTEKVNQTKAKIEEITGMHFDQFTRSMLLAQGEFSKFLKASTNERSEILEKITDTMDYSRISIAVHELRREEDNKLYKLQAGADSMSLLEEHEIHSIKNDLVVFQEKDLSLRAKEDSLRTIKNLYERVNELEGELSHLKDEELAVSKSKEEFAADLELLKNAEMVEANWSEYNALVELRKLQEQDVNSLYELKLKLPLLEQEMSEVEATNLETKKHLEVIKKEFDDELILIKSVRDIDIKIIAERKQLEDVGTQREEHIKYIEKITEDVANLKKQILNINNEIEHVEQYLNCNSVDKNLCNELELILENLRRIYKDRKSLIKYEQDLEQLKVSNERLVEESNKVFKEKELISIELMNIQAQLDALNVKSRNLLNEKTFNDSESELKSSKKRFELIEQLQKTIDELTEHDSEIKTYKNKIKNYTLEIKEYKEKIETYNVQIRKLEREIEHLELELRMLDKIKTLTQRREELVDGEPCPLCGALEHPFVSDGLPSDSSIETQLLASKNSLHGVQNEISKYKEAVVKCDTCIESYTELMNSGFNKLQNYNDIIISISSELGIDPKEDLDSVLKVEYRILSLEILKLEERLSEIKAVDSEIIKASTAICECKDRLLEQEKIAGEFLAECSAADSKQGNLSDNIIRYKANIESLTGETLGLLSKYGDFSSINTEDKLEIVANELKSRVKSYIENGELYAKLSKNKELAEAHYKELATGLDREKERLLKLETQFSSISDVFESMVRNRHQLYAQKDCDREEQRFKLLISDKEKIVSELLIRFSALNNSVTECKAKIESLDIGIKKRQDSISIKESDFKQCISELGFGSEERFVDSKLDSDVLKSLAYKNTELQNSFQSLVHRKKINISEVEKLKRRLADAESYNIVTEKLDAVSASRGSIIQKIGAMKSQLENNEAADKLLSIKKNEILCQKNICRKWGDLHELIGSADGKKYRNFAQGLTFDIMLKYANYELSRMNDRYLLSRSSTRSGGISDLLEIDVVDKDQAGEIRSAKNLSGGESFIVSLALALGLSRMSSRKVEVNSLFLDEGFGTLDEDELDKVLSALSRIQQQGKLIGVISHVSALKERIGVQITVEKSVGGKSELFGVGCSALQ